jgi:hypothetical protein
MSSEASQKLVEAPKASRGRKAHTGRYETREQLEDAIWDDYRTLKSSSTRQLAHLNGCSIAIVQNVLNFKTPYQKARRAKMIAEREPA